MPEQKLPEHKVAADDNCGSTGIEHIAQELHEPEIKETVTNKSEDKVPEEEEKKRPKQNIFVRAIKKLFGKTFG